MYFAMRLALSVYLTSLPRAWSTKTMVSDQYNCPRVWELATGYMVQHREHLVPSTGLEYFEKYVCWNGVPCSVVLFRSRSHWWCLKNDRWVKSDPCNARLVEAATVLFRMKQIDNG